MPTTNTTPQSDNRAWGFGARTAHETGIPLGLPYLTGYVLHAEIEADTAE